MSDVSGKKRLFLAVNLSVPVTRKIADAAARMRRAAEGSLRVAWVPAANLHVTLKFLGWTSADAVGAVRDKLQPVRTRKGFDVIARGAGAFPKAEAARVLWVGVVDPSGALGKLASDVDAWMSDLGFPREPRRFHPHVTVGRVKEGGAAEAVLAAHIEEEYGTSLVREVVLYESVTKSAGSEYTPLARVALDVPPFKVERQTREVEETSTESEEPDHGGQHST